MKHENLFKVISILCLVICIIAICGTIVAFGFKAWLVTESVKAIENVGGISVLFEKLFQIFS